ncbi:MAG: methionine--tRNA ligase subunit beta [Candidatus Wildermuthbacteria bacterium]|nr:methionine--tRNA ligase subunit beta [Candidatus Wildermuthbacteria bacterium]
METISFEDFKKLELRAAKVMSAEKVEGSEKLVRLQVSIGDGERQIIAGIGKHYNPEELVGREIIIVANLEPRQLMGLESQGMLLAAGEKEPVLLQPDKEVAPGSLIH